MATTSISVSCTCGKQLKASLRMAGKRAKCPACRQTLEIPAAAHESPPRSKSSASNAYDLHISGDVCPHCKAALPPEDTLCVRCGYHRGRGERLNTVVTEPLMHGLPRGFHVEEDENHLTIRWGPTLKGGLTVELAVLAVCLAVAGGIWTVHPIAAGIVLALFVLVYVTAVYRLRIGVDHQRLALSCGPFPWRHRVTPACDVAQLYCRRRCHRKPGGGGVYYTHDVWVLTESGCRYRLVSRLPVESHALAFEERIEHFLGITDREIEETWWERYGVFVRLAFMFALAIIVGIVSATL